jgi:hypothetical protein
MRRDSWFRLVGAVGTARWMRHLHAPLYRRLGGRSVLGRSLGNLTVVLATTGARTGRRRETAIWAYPGYDRYRAWSGRHIPLVVLEPI